jgi:hypothetical protein
MGGATEYIRRYKEDPRLHSSPYEFYKGRGWVDWSTFLGTNFHPTYKEAKQAVAVLQIKSYKEYKNRYKEDPRLPSHPDGFYKNKGWVDCYDFFGKKISKVYNPSPVTRFNT